MEHPTPGDLDDKTLSRLLAQVYRYTGITMAKNRGTMLQSRLRPRMRVLGLQEYSKYVDYLEGHPGEVPTFVDLITTNETYFYRTPRIWEYFSKTFLPDWGQKNLGRTLKIWSAAASSGEEAYTIAMICQEFRERKAGFQYAVIGTDISCEILATAKEGRYSGRPIDLLKIAQPDLFQKYLKEDGSVFRVCDELRARVEFKQHNLFETLKLKERFDIVFFRNVLIYFVAFDQERVLRQARQVMTPEATLIIGESESLNSLNVPFSYVAPLIYTIKIESQSTVPPVQAAA